jgi:hypothetical protein
MKNRKTCLTGRLAGTEDSQGDGHIDSIPATLDVELLIDVDRVSFYSNG